MTLNVPDKFRINGALSQLRSAHGRLFTADGPSCIKPYPEVSVFFLWDYSVATAGVAHGSLDNYRTTRPRPSSRTYFMIPSAFPHGTSSSQCVTTMQAWSSLKAAVRD